MIYDSNPYYQCFLMRKNSRLIDFRPLHEVFFSYEHAT